MRGPTSVLAAFCASLLLAPPAHAELGAPYLVKDINDSQAGMAVPLAVLPDGRVLLSAQQRETGQELWVTDGTPAGTILLADAWPGQESGLDLASPMVVVDARAFYVTDEAAHGQRLWTSDGTPAGTHVLHVNGWSIQQLTAAGDRLFFVASGIDGPRLWMSNATDAGTQEVSNAVSGYAQPYDLFPFGDGILFSAEDAAHGRELWRSDGTPEGTAMVSDLVPGAESSDPEGLQRVGDVATFVARDPSHGRELWRTDGIEAGTALVVDLNPGPGDTAFEEQVSTGSRLFFAADDCEHGMEPWVSDGTPEHTYLVANLAGTAVHSGTEIELGSSPRQFVASGDAVFFVASSPFVPQLWWSDGTEAGTIQLTTLPSDPYPYFTGMTVVAGRLFFGVTSYNAGTALWQSDGTPTGTHPRATWPFAAVLPAGDHFYAALVDSIPGAEVVRSDGTPEGTVVLASFVQPTGSSYVAQPIAVGDHWLFTTTDFLAFTKGLWVTDGTAESTHRIGNVSIYLTTWVGRTSDQLLFNAPGAWHSDGTAAGTGPLPFIPYLGGALVVGSQVYFTAVSDLGSRQLWKTDLTPEGTTLLVETSQALPYSGEIANLAATLDGVYFTVGHRELWRTNGTPCGTNTVKQFGYPIAIGELLGAEHRLFLTVFTEEYGAELWTSDGTTDGTHMVSDLRPGPDSSAPSNLFAVGASVIFGARDDDGPLRLWRSDGTPEGTVVIHNVAPGYGPFGPAFEDPSGTPYLLFFGYQDETGYEPWRTDGTTPGTWLLRDIRPGPASSIERVDLRQDPPAAAAGHFVFAADEGEHGIEPWMTDGTSEGTALLADLRPGENGSAPHTFAAGPSAILFTADDGFYGREVWGIPAVTSVTTTTTTAPEWTTSITCPTVTTTTTATTLTTSSTVPEETLRLHPLAGERLLIRADARGKKGRLRLTSIVLPQALAVGDDPTAADGTIRIRSTQGAGFDWTHALDRSKWRFVSREGWRYGDDGTIQRLTVGPDRHIKLVTRAIADVVLESDPHPVDVTITVGRDRYCLRFGGEMTFRRLKKFRAKDAPAPQTCTP